jgi:hypothetical protein
MTAGNLSNERNRHAPSTELDAAALYRRVLADVSWREATHMASETGIRKLASAEVT